MKRKRGGEECSICPYEVIYEVAATFNKPFLFIFGTGTVCGLFHRFIKRYGWRLYAWCYALW